MEWIVGVYLVIGVFRTIGKFSNPNPAVKPLWMLTESDGFKLAFLFTIYTLFWPFTRQIMEVILGGIAIVFCIYLAMTGYLIPLLIGGFIGSFFGVAGFGGAISGMIPGAIIGALVSVAIKKKSAK